MSETTIMTVLEEIDRIRSADLHYWKAGQEQSRDARAEYHRRQHRLEEIRADRSAEFGVSPSQSRTPSRGGDGHFAGRQSSSLRCHQR